MLLSNVQVKELLQHCLKRLLPVCRLSHYQARFQRPFLIMSVCSDSSESTTYEDATKDLHMKCRDGCNLANRKKISFWATVLDGVSYPENKFRSEVDHYVHDPAGWSTKGYDFVLKREKPDILFCLVPDRADLYGLSLSHPGKCLVEINATNYLNGVKRTKLDLNGYRQYVISHELGHMLGHEHSNPHPHGQPVPIMHQQTRLGVEGFTPNNKVDPSVQR